MRRKTPRRPLWFGAAHAIALVVASLVATVILFEAMLPPVLLFILTCVVLTYASAVGLPAYAMLSHLRRTGWISTAIAGAVITLPLSAFLASEGVLPVFHLGAAGIAGALTFRAGIVLLAGSDALPGRDVEA